MGSQSEEDRYFAEEEARRRAELRAAYEKAARELEAREKTARAAGTSDLELAERLRVLGFDGDDARLLDILPLVLVAWADGSVSRRERAVVMSAVEARGVAPHDETWIRAAAMLEEAPSEALTTEILAILRQLVGTDAGRAEDIVERCVQVAEATRSLLGLGAAVSAEERATIESIAAQFSPGARDAVHNRLAGR